MTALIPTCRPKPDTQRVFPAFSATEYGTKSAVSAGFGFFGQLALLATEQTSFPPADRGVA